MMKLKYNYTLREKVINGGSFGIIPCDFFVVVVSKITLPSKTS